MAALLGCSQQHSQNLIEDSLDVIFPLPNVVVPLYANVDDQQLGLNYIAHIRNGSKEQHRYAVQRLLERPQYADAVAAELAQSTTDKYSIGVIVSLCQVISDIGDNRHADSVLPFISTIYPPIVRSAAFQALAKIAPSSFGDDLIAAHKNEVESSPSDACLTALSQGGSDVGLSYIHQLVLKWISEKDNGLQSSWNALLLNTNPNLLDVLINLEPLLSPFMALQAYGVRISLGDRDLVNQISNYIDSSKYPSAGTRSLAVQLIGELQQWQTVLDLVPANNEKLDLAIIGLFSRDDAPRDKAIAALDIYSEQASMTVRRKALSQLLKVGKSSYFDSYLLELQEYPYTQGALLSLTLLTDMQGLPQHAADIMISRWNYCDDYNHKLSLVRALVRCGLPKATNFLGRIMLEAKEDPEVIKFISEIIGNAGPQSIDWFLKLWADNPGPDTVKVVFLALSRYSEVPEVEQLFVDTARSSTVSPFARRFVLELMHKVYPHKTAKWFAEWHDVEPHKGVRAFYNQFLNSYY